MFPHRLVVVEGQREWFIIRVDRVEKSPGKPLQKSIEDLTSG